MELRLSTSPVDDLICEARGITPGQLAEMRSCRAFEGGTAPAATPVAAAHRILTDEEIVALAIEIYESEGR